jgi:hypothetical protein
MATHSRTKQSSRTKEILSLLEKRSLGILQPRSTKQIYQAAIKFNNFEFSRSFKFQSIISSNLFFLFAN